jgi:hypothetical protein
MALLACIFSFIFFSHSDANSQTNQSYQDSNVTSKVYTHPVKGFSLKVPNDVVLSERQPPVDISLNSRKGWGMTIQSAVTNPSISLDELAARLETKYLGQQKPWTQKLQGTRRIFKEFQAIDSVYDGSGMRARVVIIRSTLQDYVVIFIAPVDLYSEALKDFEDILISFDPIPNAGQSIKDDPADLILNPNNQSINEENLPPPEQIDYIALKNKALGYAILYPNDWRIGKPDDFTVVFTGPKETNESKLAVTIQNVSSPIQAPPKDMANAVLQQLKTQMAYSSSNVQHIGGGIVTIAGINGVQLVSDFIQKDFPYRQWSIIIPRPIGNVVHVWTYIAPRDQFNDFRSIMETMINSWNFELAS